MMGIRRVAWRAAGEARGLRRAQVSAGVEGNGEGRGGGMQDEERRRAGRAGKSKDGLNLGGCKQADVRMCNERRK